MGGGEWGITQIGAIYKDPELQGVLTGNVTVKSNSLLADVAMAPCNHCRLALDLGACTVDTSMITLSNFGVNLQ